MIKLYSSRQQDMTRAIVLSLRDGMSSFNSLCDSLLHEDLTSGYQNIRKLIVKAEQDMKKAEKEAEGELKKLDEDTENLTAQQYKFDKQREEKKLSLDNLKTTLDAERQSLKNSEEALEQARECLQKAENTLESQRGRQSNAKTMTDVGRVLTYIPFVNLMGPPLTIFGNVEMVQAAKAVRDAKEEVEKSGSEVKHFSDKVSDYQSKISETKRDISQTDEELKQVREKIAGVKRQREALAEFQEKMRSAVHLLGRLSGTADVLELQTRRLIFLEPVMKVMEDVVKVAGEITGNQVLQDEGVMSLVDAMRETNRGLAAVCASDNSPALENEGKLLNQ